MVMKSLFPPEGRDYACLAVTNKKGVRFAFCLRKAPLSFSQSLEGDISKI
jgi:hypothetical protein